MCFHPGKLRLESKLGPSPPASTRTGGGWGVWADVSFRSGLHFSWFCFVFVFTSSCDGALQSVDPKQYLLGVGSGGPEGRGPGKPRVGGNPRPSIQNASSREALAVSGNQRPTAPEPGPPLASQNRTPRPSQRKSKKASRSRAQPRARGSPIHGRPLASSPSPGSRTPAHTRILCPQSRATAWSVAPARSAACWGAAHAASARPTARGCRRVCRSAARTAPPTETSANCAPRAAADTRTCASCTGAAAAVRGAGLRGSANQGPEGGSRWAEPIVGQQIRLRGRSHAKPAQLELRQPIRGQRGGAWRIRSANQKPGGGARWRRRLWEESGVRFGMRAGPRE